MKKNERKICLSEKLEYLEPDYQKWLLPYKACSPQEAACLIIGVNPIKNRVIFQNEYDGKIVWIGDVEAQKIFEILCDGDTSSWMNKSFNIYYYANKAIESRISINEKLLRSIKEVFLNYLEEDRKQFSTIFRYLKREIDKLFDNLAEDRNLFEPDYEAEYYKGDWWFTEAACFIGELDNKFIKMRSGVFDSYLHVPSGYEHVQVLASKLLSISKSINPRPVLPRDWIELALRIKIPIPSKPWNAVRKGFLNDCEYDESLYSSSLYKAIRKKIELEEKTLSNSPIKSNKIRINTHEEVLIDPKTETPSKKKKKSFSVIGKEGAKIKNKKYDQAKQVAREYLQNMLLKSEQYKNMMSDELIKEIKKYLDKRELMNKIKGKKKPYSYKTVKGWVRDLIPSEKIRSGTRVNSCLGLNGYLFLKAKRLFRL